MRFLFLDVIIGRCVVVSGNVVQYVSGTFFLWRGAVHEHLEFGALIGSLSCGAGGGWEEGCGPPSAPYKFSVCGRFYGMQSAIHHVVGVCAVTCGLHTVRGDLRRYMLSTYHIR